MLPLFWAGNFITWIGKRLAMKNRTILGTIPQKE